MKISEEKTEDGYQIVLTPEDMIRLRVNLSHWLHANNELDIPAKIVRIIMAIMDNHYWMYANPHYYSESTKEFLKELYNIK